VQGNDRRLKEASDASYGIMKFATDGGVEALTAYREMIKGFEMRRHQPGVLLSLLKMEKKKKALQSRVMIKDLNLLQQ
jgi:hypothetical protein